jgi:hypothetical protein
MKRARETSLDISDEGLSPDNCNPVVTHALERKLQIRDLPTTLVTTRAPLTESLKVLLKDVNVHLLDAFSLHERAEVDFHGASLHKENKALVQLSAAKSSIHDIVEVYIKDAPQVAGGQKKSPWKKLSPRRKLSKNDSKSPVINADIMP